MPGMTKRRITEGLSGLSQPEIAADVKAFFAETPLPEAATSLAQNLELLDANVLLRERRPRWSPSTSASNRDGPRTGAISYYVDT